MKIKAFFPVAVITFGLLIILGCASIEYDGKSHAPTSNVKIYVKESEVPHPFEVMGNAKLTAPIKYKRTDVENKLISRAEDEGADAVLLTKYIKVKSYQARNDQVLNEKSGPTWSVNNTTQDNLNAMQKNLKDSDNMSVRPPKTSPKEVIYQIKAEAKFLKYKK